MEMVEQTRDNIMSEKNAYSNFRSNIIQRGDRIERVENLLVTGMPDVNYCFNGIEGWIELKQPTEPKRLSTRLFGSNHKLSQDQMNWFKAHMNANGRGHILIATDKRWFLIDGKHADSINEMDMTEIVIYSEWTTKKPVKDKEQWKLLRIALLK